MSKKPYLKVAVGVIVCSSYVLLALRSKHLDYAGFWEFPGGKLNAEESAYAALCRELKEELGITVLSAQSLETIWYEYPKYWVCLYPWIVNEFEGVATGMENQEVRWVLLSDLGHYQMLEANQAIVNRLLYRQSLDNLIFKDTK